MLLSKNMNRSTAFKVMLSSEKYRILTSISCAVLCSFVEVIPWLYLYFSLNAIYAGNSVHTYLAIMAIALIVRYALYALAVWYAHLAAYHIIQKVRQHLVEALAHMKIDKLRRLKRGDIERRIADDCQNLEPLIAHHGTDIVNGLLMPVFITALLFYIDWRLALIALAPLPLALTAQFLMMRGFAERQEKYTQIVSNMHQAQLEFLRSIGVMKLFAVDADSYLELSRTMRSHNKIVTAYTRQMVGAWITFVTLAQVSLALVVPVAILLVELKQLSVVDLVMVVCLSAGLLKPWLDLTQVFSQIQQSIVSIDRILPLCSSNEVSDISYKQPLDVLSCEKMIVTRGKLTVLNNINLRVEPGQRVLIEGESGSGKSTLLSTLSGALTPDAGGWKINGEFVHDFDDESRSRYIAAVDQEVNFFTGTLKENLLLSKHEVQDEEIWMLLEAFGLKQLVSDLPNQLSSSIGETSRLFSGGEMQRLAIIRAVLAKKPILILDEATAHLDQLNEQKSLSALRAYAPNQIQLIISHRSRQVKQVDAHFKIHSGSIKEVSLV